VEKFSESETKSQLYEPLNSHDKEIRLVILQQGRFKDTVRCSLSKVSLIDEPSFKHYHIPGATLVSLVKYTSMGILIKLPLIWSPRSDIYDMSLNLESYGLIRHAPLSTDPWEIPQKFEVQTSIFRGVSFCKPDPLLPTFGVISPVVDPCLHNFE
jgi:hypothetical protein